MSTIILFTILAVLCAGSGFAAQFVVDKNTDTVVDVDGSADGLTASLEKVRQVNAAIGTDEYGATGEIEKTSAVSVLVNEDEQTLELYKEVGKEWVVFLGDRLEMLFNQQQEHSFMLADEGGERDIEVLSTQLNTVNGEIGDTTFDGGFGVGGSSEVTQSDTELTALNEGSVILGGEAVGDSLVGAEEEIVVVSNTTIGEGRFAQVYNITESGEWQDEFEIGPLVVAVNYTRDINVAPYVDTEREQPVGVDIDLDQAMDVNVTVKEKQYDAILHRA